MTDFGTFWLVYPRRKGPNPRFKAEQKWHAAIKSGADPFHMVSSARKYAAELKAMGKYDTEYVCMAQTWLNQRRWLDYALDVEGEQRREADMDTMMAKRGWKWNGAKWEQMNVGK